MKRLLPLAALLILAHHSSAEKRTIPCKTPAIASSCYVTHGRLNIWQGAVNFRLWEIGTNHMLGIYSGLSDFVHPEAADTESPQLPTNLDKLFYPDGLGVFVYADFEVCPLEPRIPGHMQPACIESATHLVVKRY